MDESGAGTQQDEWGEYKLTVTFEDGEPQMIRSDLRLVGSDAVFEVDDGTARLIGHIRGDLEEIATEVRKLPFIEDVDLEAKA